MIFSFLKLKKISTKWPNGEWTKQIVLESGKRLRVYCCHPLEFGGTYITDMTEGELGKLYESKDMNINADKPTDEVIKEHY